MHTVRFLDIKKYDLVIKFKLFNVISHIININFLMKLTIKTLKQISYSVDVLENSNISDLKQILEDQQGFDSKSIKLLFNGKVLEDANNLTALGIKEGNVIMMMNAKAKPQNIGVKEEKKEEETLPSNLENKNTIVKKKEKKIDRTINNYTNQVHQLKEMGFSEEQSKAALEASNGDIAMAIEFLYNGIPTSNNTDQQIFHDFMDVPEGEEDEPYELDPELLRNIDLNQPDTLKRIASIVKVLIQEDPSQLSNLLLDIEDMNPDIFDFIRDNESEFKSLIEKPLNNEDIQVFEKLIPHGNVNQEEESHDSGLEEGIENFLSNVNSIIGQSQLPSQVPDTDKEAVERLIGLGFSEAEAYQAYMACDKNETLAANLLFDNKLKDNDMEIDCNYNFIMLDDGSSQYDK